MARSDKLLSFRVPEELKETLQLEALVNKRTLNQEILYRLETTLPENNPKRNVIFTEWRPLLDFEDSQFMQNNEGVRMECSKYMSRFFQERPTYKLITFEFISRTTKKGHEFLYGIRIWYSYPVGE